METVIQKHYLITVLDGADKCHHRHTDKERSMLLALNDLSRLYKELSTE